MSNSVKNRSGVGLPPKADRRAAGKLAREKRRRAEARMRWLKVGGTVVGVVAVVVGVAFAFGAFGGDGTATPQASSSAAALDPALQTQPVVTAGTGEVTALKVDTLITGTGPKTESGQTLSTNYVGVLYATGEKFDASWDKGEPITFPLGVGRVIQGWDQGLVGIPVGSRVQLDIPSDLAYGPNAEAEGNPPGALRFVVDILSAT